MHGLQTQWSQGLRRGARRDRTLWEGDEPAEIELTYSITRATTGSAPARVSPPSIATFARTGRATTSTPCTSAGRRHGRTASALPIRNGDRLRRHQLTESPGRGYFRQYFHTESDFRSECTH